MSQVLFHTTRRGIIAHFAADECIGQSLDRYGEWAEDEIGLLRDYIPAGSTVVDVGANVGVHTLAFAAFVGRNGQVIAIEGQPEIAMLLSYNVVTNRLTDRVKVISALAGAAPQSVDYLMRNPGANMGAMSFVNHVHAPGRAEHHPGIKVALALMTVDSLGLASCAAIKIDVEGMEEDVLLGAKETIQNHHPVIYFEHASGNPAVLDRLIELLSGLDYRLFWHEANPFNSLNFKGSRINIFGGNIETNVLALPSSRTPPNLPLLQSASSIPKRPSLSEGMRGVAVRSSWRKRPVAVFFRLASKRWTKTLKS